MNNLQDILHLLLCQAPHKYNMIDYRPRLPTVCYSYIEESIAEGTTLQDHLSWEAITEQFIATLNLKNPAEALTFIKAVLKLSQDFRDLTLENPERSNFIRTLIF